MKYIAIADGKEIVIHAKDYAEALKIAQQYMKQYNVTHIEVKQ